MDRIAVFAEITVTVLDDRRANRFDFEAWVLAAAGCTLALEPVDRTHVLKVPDTATPGFLTFEHGDQLVALRGFVVALEGAGDIRFVVCDDVHQPRRGSTRANIKLPVRFLPGGDRQPVSGVTVNLSMDGLLAECDAELHVGGPVAVEIALPGDDDPLTVMGDIIRRDDAVGRPGAVAMRFDHGEGTTTRSRLAAVVVEWNRSLLRAQAPAANS